MKCSCGWEGLRAGEIHIQKEGCGTDWTLEKIGNTEVAQILTRIAQLSDKDYDEFVGGLHDLVACNCCLHRECSGWCCSDPAD